MLKVLHLGILMHCSLERPMYGHHVNILFCSFGRRHYCFNLQYIFHKGSERRTKYIQRQILIELWNTKSSIFAHYTTAFLTPSCGFELQKYKNSEITCHLIRISWKNCISFIVIHSVYHINSSNKTFALFLYAGKDKQGLIKDGWVNRFSSKSPQLYWQLREFVLKRLVLWPK